ncbi:TonB-linked SusC/RagA family outer membrane protein [Pedobacter sp. CG_S7]|uniref:SusC/RagA family TonB-linked outer membrane protein n=1 Tax=Pedobacter sp. CG_S7 TaxID=3143930 RepID=UPI00339B266F
MKVFYLLKPCLLLLILLATFVAKAQTSSLTGTILDETGQSLPGASIQIKSLNRSTTTDVSGKYRLTGLTNGSIVVTVSYVGYSSTEQTVIITGNTNADFSVKPDAQNLNEVVVIGYGTVQKKDLTGSVATVSSKDFQSGNITSPEQLISGKVAGVQITSNSGQPGAGSVIRIRGGASLNASNDPLIVIDGIPLSGSAIGGAANPLSLINPNDIETFTILKDANATAIYGSRASNGVVLITTKKGKSGAAIINFSTVNSYSTVANKVAVLSAGQLRAYVAANDKAYDDVPTHTYSSLLGKSNTDWQDEIYQNAFTTDNNISIAGAFKDVPYRVSVGYLDQQGSLITDRLKRASGGFRISPSLFDNHLKIDLNLKGTLSNSHFANTGAVASAIQFDATQAVYATNQFGNYFEWITGTVPNPNAPRNPVGLVRLQNNDAKADRSFGNAQVDYSFHFLPELHANVNLGYDISKGQGWTRVPDFAAQSASTKGSMTHFLSNQNNTFLEAYLSYAKELTAINSNISATAGYGYYDNYNKDYNFDAYDAAGNVRSTPKFPFGVQQNKLLSYYGRLNYTLADKYILSATMRADASSKFSEQNRWGYFPSAGFTWRAIGEEFLKNSEVVSDLKLRLSYGETGNKDGIGNYDYLSKYYLNTNTGQYQVGGTYYDYYSPSAYDPDLKWETTKTYNAGIDYGFFKGRVYGSVDVYYKKTKDLLSTIDIPVGVNFSNRLTTNVGNMENKGIEASVNIGVIKSEDLNWDLGFNMAYNKRLVTNLTVNPDPNFKVDAGGITGGTGINIKYNTPNQIPGTFYVYQQVYNDNGVPLEGVYADLNGDGVINTSDQYYYKSPEPQFLFGFTTAVNYRKWTLSTVLRASLGNYVYDNVSSNLGVKNNILSPSGLVNNANPDVLFTNFTGNQYLSDYYIKNASFLKMDNLGLSFNAGNLSKNSNANLRISANCQNVFVVTDYKGIDPELSNGIDYNLYPRPRIFSLGVNVGF